MDDKTKTVMLTLATGVIKKGLLVAGTSLAGHGIINGSQTETFVSVGMVLVGLGWSFWNDYGKAIVLSQLEVLKAKSLAQAAKLNQAGISPVTTSQIAAQSPTLTAAEVIKMVATLPPAIQANVATAPVATEGTVASDIMKGVARILVAGFVLCGLLASFPGDALAQIKKPQITGNVIADTRANLGIGGASGGATGNPLGDIIGALDEKLLPDLQYAFRLATASNSKVTAPCYQAWIGIIETRQKAVTGADGQAIDLPNPRLITDFEKLVELRNALQPDSDFMLKCSPVASMVRKDIIGFIGIVISGGAGLAALGL